MLRAPCVDVGDPGLPYLAMVDLARAVKASAGADPEVAAVLDALPLVAGLTDPNASMDDPVDESRRLQLFDAMAARLATRCASPCSRGCSFRTVRATPSRRT